MKMSRVRAAALPLIGLSLALLLSGCGGSEDSATVVDDEPRAVSVEVPEEQAEPDPESDPEAEEATEEPAPSDGGEAVDEAPETVNEEVREEVVAEPLDPTPNEELNTPAPDSTSVPPTVLGQVDFGGRGWDSSRYPVNNPIPTPASWTLFQANDGEAHPDAQGRYWEYLAPPGSSITEACNQMLSGLAAYGMEIALSGCANAGASTGMRPIRISAEGPGVRATVSLVSEGAPCFGADRDARCGFIIVFLRLE